MALFETSPLHQFSKFNHFLLVWTKIFPILYPPLENSTTRIAITYVVKLHKSREAMLDQTGSSEIRQQGKSSMYLIIEQANCRKMLQCSPPYDNMSKTEFIFREGQEKFQANY